MAVDATYQVKNYEQEGGNTWVVGGTLEIANGGTILMDSGAALLQGANAVASSGAVRAGQHTVTSGEVTATNATIATGITTLVAMLVMIERAGKVATSDAAVSFASGNIVVAAGTSYALTANDVVNWIAVGA